MGHTIWFDRYENISDQVSKEEVSDLLSFFYRWGDASFEIVCHDENPHKRGSHVYVPTSRKHIITLSRPAIERSVRMGYDIGGSFPAPTVRLGIAMVLVHEIQHANQAGLHEPNENFYTHRVYISRPCEREARNFVDENRELIWSLMDPERVALPARRLSEREQRDRVEDIAELFSDLSEVWVDDIREELRLSGLNFSKNVEIVRMILGSRGVEIREGGRGKSTLTGIAPIFP